MVWVIFVNIFNIIPPIFIMNNCCNINYTSMKPIKTNRKVHHHVMNTCTLHTHTHIYYVNETFITNNNTKMAWFL